jgi:hypothetical protein
VSLPDLAETVEECCARAGLRASMKGDLKSYPGSIHWHFQRPGHRGTLEATLWPMKRRLWLSIHSGRTGEWTSAAAVDLRAALEERVTQAPDEAANRE